ncbi:uncharacterized protein LOC126577729 [Anopheles aquasalis]|uniref:uncharacterized protein LOC126577729 n=1 Tax=Anopheles aquasalis TaxID=42839 RepID=UPI00215AA467|nr:uncharacterized protein LOC126577729 [Anopheles aquasalis]XP_050095547.1 uncharacterized protein LOC126577729 [Anopheles aquasalis]
MKALGGGGSRRQRAGGWCYRFTIVLLLLLLLHTLDSVRSSASAASTPASRSICNEDAFCTCRSSSNSGGTTSSVFVTIDCVLDGDHDGTTRTNAVIGVAPSTITTVASDQHQQQRRRFVLDGQLHLPPNASALNIRLIAGAQLSITREFFRHDIINRLWIDGDDASGHGTSRWSTVEFHENALCNNDGSYPEVLVTNLGQLVLNRNVSCGEYRLNITHVRDVHLRKQFLGKVEAEVWIQHVAKLQIADEAFYGSHNSKVQIHDANIESLQRLGASLRLLHFERCNISDILSNAMGANEVGHIEFIGCRINRMYQQAIPGQLLCRSLTFRDCSISKIDKQFIDGSGLEEFNLERNSIDNIAPGALTFTSVRTSIRNNFIVRTGKDWLNQTEWTNVTITGNSFGEFDGFSLSNKPVPGAASQHCVFGNNTLTKAHTRSFSFGAHCQMEALHFARICDCAYDSWLAELFGLPTTATVSDAMTSVASCQVEESLRYCFNQSGDGHSGTEQRVNVQYFLNEFCRQEGSEKCSSYAAAGSGQEAHQKHHKPPPMVPLDAIDSLDSAEQNSWLPGNSIWFLVGGGAILLFLLCTALAALSRKRCGQRETGGTPESMTTRSNHHYLVSQQREPITHNGSSFTSLQRRVIVTSLDWVRESCGHKVWCEIDAPMQQLLNPPNGVPHDEQEKVRLIGLIIQSLNDHHITGDQMVALTDILYRHLGPPAAGTAPPTVAPIEPSDHIYDELQLNRATTTAAPRNVRMTEIGLLGDYAAPLDHGGLLGGPPVEGIYSEPIQRDEQQLLQHTIRTRNLISPYAIADATAQLNPLGDGGNLPDIVQRRPGCATAGGSTTGTWNPGRNRNAEDGDDDRDDDDDDDDDDDEDFRLGDGGDEEERKTMLRPPYLDAVDGGSSGGPTYALPMKKVKRRTQGATERPIDEDGASGGGDGNRSEHSGSSMQTVRIEDITAMPDGGDSGRSEQMYGGNK